MKTVMTENEMEKYLEEHGYDITVGKEKIIDSTLVSEYAVRLGYEIVVNKDTGENTFILI